ncbi:hypothetical protein B0T49_14805 [Chromobacterium violaceum]|nr:hypothetical protein [Chromobacterium violaceum]OQS46251.1 hypothetical protein B0T48_16020 [Chromobacterium violaceum]OQS48694.1 hypothetical protein B0T49_14805 [Chromobacterium violaceum]
MQKKLGSKDLDDLIEYVAGQAAWEFPKLPREKVAQEEVERRQWSTHLMSLDTAILSLLGDNVVSDDEVEAKLDDVLSSSLFERRLARKMEKIRKVLRTGLKARAKYIWSHTTAQQRRGYFLAGVGLATGTELDSKAVELEALLLQANVAICTSDEDSAVEAIIAFAEIAFQISPFVPKRLIDNWKDVLSLWLKGLPVTSLQDDEGGDSDEAISFIEHAFVYNLPWAMEAVRVRAAAHEEPSLDEVQLSDYPRAHAVAALETGTLSIAAATLIQAGFASRLAAIKATEDTEATFDSLAKLRKWLRSAQVRQMSKRPDWPTPETHQLWLDFVAPSGTLMSKPWTTEKYNWPVRWHDEAPEEGTALRIGGGPGKEHIVYSADFTELGVLKYKPEPDAVGVINATVSGSPNQIKLEYIGPDDYVVL